MGFVVRLLLAALIDSRQRKRQERRAMADDLAFWWIASAVTRYGSDEQLNEVYEVMHGRQAWRYCDHTIPPPPTQPSA